MNADVVYVSGALVTAYVLGWTFGAIFNYFKSFSEKLS